MIKKTSVPRLIAHVIFLIHNDKIIVCENDVSNEVIKSVNYVIKV
jgi:hypothetical protein